MISPVKFGATFTINGIPPEELKKIQDAEVGFNAKGEQFVFNKEVASDRLSPFVEGDKLIVLTDHPVDRPASNYFMVLQMLKYFDDKLKIKPDILNNIRDNFKKFMVNVKEADTHDIDVQVQ